MRSENRGDKHRGSFGNLCARVRNCVCDRELYLSARCQDWVGKFRIERHRAQNADDVVATFHAFEIRNGDEIVLAR